MSHLSAFPSHRSPSPSRPARCVRWALVAAIVLAVGASMAQPVDFTLRDMDGKEHRLSDYRGQWVVVNYWATWCPPCLEELPELDAFHTSNQGKAVVLGVNMEDIGEAQLRAFVDRQFLSFPILRTSANPERSELVGLVPGLPTTYLVTPSGELAARQVGQVTADGLNSFISRSESR
jgi:thiol-disulfide isomerase/thioredoxin